MKESAMTAPKLDLTGNGGHYLRVSGNKQDVERQIAARQAFEKRHGVRIAPSFLYEDDMPRDLSEKRPDFQRMKKAVEAGQLQWIFLDHIDRFGYADEDEIVERIIMLRKAGCKLIDADDEDWTKPGMLSLIKAAMAGAASKEEQDTKSHRALSGMIPKAKAGEWQGGLPKLGFDVGCFDRATGAELWRVVWQGREKRGLIKRKGKMRPNFFILRLKVFPDGTSERFDGNAVLRTSKDSQVLRLTPTKDEAKLAAAKGVFSRYATETVTFFALARWLNDLGMRNSVGQRFQARDIIRMLDDESYLGYPTFAKRRSGRFRRVQDGEDKPIDPALRLKNTANEPEHIIKSATRFFDPIIDRPTWDAVQKKRERRTATTRAPKNPSMYLAGLVRCAGCGQDMTTRSDRAEYYCSTWSHHQVRGDLANSPCLRNRIKQATLERHIEKYLADSGQRLEILTSGMDTEHLTDKLEGEARSHWEEFALGLERLQIYLSKHHAEEYREVYRYNHGDDCTEHEFIDGLIKLYRKRFDPSQVALEIEQLDDEHTEMTEGFRELKSPLAIEKANKQLAELEGRIEALRRQQQDASAVVEEHYTQLSDLQKAIADAKRAMTKGDTETAYRQRAEALRGLLWRIDCSFIVTGKKVWGGGSAGSVPSVITFLPISGGDAVHHEIETSEAGCSRSQGVPKTRARSSSNSPSQRAMTHVARQLPITLTHVRPMSISSSTPKMTATPSAP
jgi:DNA invertase Pin-like site-specific DNA recombinase